MDKELRDNKKGDLTSAIAEGESIRDWAARNGVSPATAYRWASEPEVRRGVEAWRRGELDRALGRLASLSRQAADGIKRLASEAESESVQLRACRAILADQMAVSRFSDLEQRLVEIEEQVRDRIRQKNASD
jgi:hypothetical protein